MSLEKTETIREILESEVINYRIILNSDLLKMIIAEGDELVRIGFTPEMAHFHCVCAMKTIIDELYDELNPVLSRVNSFDGKEAIDL